MSLNTIPHLLVKSPRIENLEAEGYEVEDIDKARMLLKKAVEAGTSGSRQDFVLKAALKPLIQRFDPSFDESNYGFKSFTEFLSACKDIVEVTQGEHDHIVTLKGTNHTVEHGSREGTSNRYEIILKKQQIGPINPRMLDIALEEAFKLLHDQEINTIQFRGMLTEKTSKREPGFTDADATKVRAVLYKAMVFRYLDKNRTTLMPGINSIDDLRHRVRYTLLKRVLDNTSEEDPNAELLSDLIFGTKLRVDEVYMLLAEYNKAEQGA